MSTTAYRLFAIAQNSNSFLEASKFGLYSAKVLFNSMVHSCSRFGLEISAPPQILDHNLNLKLLQPQRNISILMFWAFSFSCFGTCNSLLMYPRICIFFARIPTRPQTHRKKPALGNYTTTSMSPILKKSLATSPFLCFMSMALSSKSHINR